MRYIFSIYTIAPSYYRINITINISYVNINLTSDNTTKTDLWNCQIELCDDESLCSNWVNSSNLSVLNYPIRISDALGNWSNVLEDFSPNFSQAPK